MREAWQKKKLIEVALNKKKIASLLIGIYMKILCMLLLFVQIYKKFLKKTNFFI